MCPSPTAIPYADFERVEGWLTSNGAIHGTVLEYGCRVGYRDSRTPCLPARRTCHAGKWVGRMPSCVPFDYCERPPIIRQAQNRTNIWSVLNTPNLSTRAEFDLPGNREIGKIPLRHDRSVKIQFTDKLAQV